MKTIRSGLLILAFSLSSTLAHAQRRVLPVIDLVDVPVTLANAKALTAEQVRGAIVSAALAAEWDVEPQSDGSLRLSALREMDYRITVRATYAPTTYSLTYVSSENLKTTDVGINTPDRPGFDSLADYVKQWRAARGARQPEYKFAVDRAGAYIHPTYELMVYELSAGVRRHLRLIQ